MKIDEVSNVLHEKYHEIITDKNDNYIPKLAIYMDREFYAECIREINGEVSSNAIDFCNCGKLMGYPVWRVMPTYSREGEGEDRHPPFTIVNLDL